MLRLTKVYTYEGDRSASCVHYAPSGTMDAMMTAKADVWVRPTVDINLPSLLTTPPGSTGRGRRKL